MAKKFKRRPVVARAIQNTGKNLKSLALFIGCDVSELRVIEGGIVIREVSNRLVAIIAHHYWVVKEYDGTRSYYHPDSFAEEYEPV